MPTVFGSDGSSWNIPELQETIIQAHELVAQDGKTSLVTHNNDVDGAHLVLYGTLPSNEKYIRCQDWRPTKGERPSRDHPWQQDRHRYRAQVRRLVLTKKKPSRFFGTPLLPYLVGRQIDTLVLTSSSIGNCVRPAVFDAFSSKIL